MTEQPPNQDHPDDWSRRGHDPGEPYYGEQYGSEADSPRPGPPAGSAMPTAPLWQAPAQGVQAQGAPQPRGREQGALQPGVPPPGPGRPGAPQPGAFQRGAPPPGTPQPGAFQPGAPQPGAFQQDMSQSGRADQGAAQPRLGHQGAGAKGFFGSLFDFSFTSFVTTRIIKVLYALIMVMAVLSALLFTVAMFRVSAGLGLLTLIIGDPLFIIIVMAFWRLVLESFVVVFRIAEDVRAMRERGDR